MIELKLEKNSDRNYSGQLDRMIIIVYSKAGEFYWDWITKGVRDKPFAGSFLVPDKDYGVDIDVFPKGFETKQSALADLQRALNELNYEVRVRFEDDIEE